MKVRWDTHMRSPHSGLVSSEVLGCPVVPYGAVAVNVPSSLVIIEAAQYSTFL